jgi:NADPH-dependent 2,4-dienoyl-CoA reductase/sulfur reductase-like enzyme
MTAIAHFPKDDSTNGWSRIVPAGQPNPSLDREVAAEWVVIGGGFAGLAAARRLTENRPQD